MAPDELHAQPVSVRRHLGGRPRRPPSSISVEERRKAVAYWKRVGVLDADGRPSDRWHRSVGAFVD